MQFPAGFLWGAATSAYQIEGATATDGRGESIWDVFARQKGGTFQNQSGQPACDHYRRYAEDVALMSRLGLGAYRFSIAWPRIMPDESRAINPAGLAFYDRLTDALLAAGIEPWITLYHWDLPYWIYRRGGWLNRDTADLFAEYTSAVVDRLSDRVTRWMTLNEPQVFIKFGLGDGVNAPGSRLPTKDLTQAVHVSLLAHGRCCQTIRARARKPPTVGWALVGRTDFPASDSAADIEAARRSMMAPSTDLWNNTWYANPAVLGHYPEDGLAAFGPDGPEIRPGDLELIRQPLDFYGVNTYDGRPVRAGKDGAPEVLTLPHGHPQTAIRWFVTPKALRWGPRFLYERYRTPIYITENGMSGHDWVGLDGRCRDPHRIDYTTRYLRELRRAIGDGADIRGYFHWSLLDNYEWANGHQDRFGLIHVDIATGTRTPKDSFEWYRGVIRENGANLGEADY